MGVASIFNPLCELLEDTDTKGQVYHNREEIVFVYQDDFIGTKSYDDMVDYIMLHLSDYPEYATYKKTFKFSYPWKDVKNNKPTYCMLEVYNGAIKKFKYTQFTTFNHRASNGVYTTSVDIKRWMLNGGRFLTEY